MISLNVRYKTELFPFLSYMVNYYINARGVPFYLGYSELKQNPMLTADMLQLDKVSFIPNGQNVNLSENVSDYLIIDFVDSSNIIHKIIAMGIPLKNGGNAWLMLGIDGSSLTDQAFTYDPTSVSNFIQNAGKAQKQGKPSPAPSASAGLSWILVTIIGFALWFVFKR